MWQIIPFGYLYVVDMPSSGATRGRRLYPPSSRHESQSAPAFTKDGMDGSASLAFVFECSSAPFLRLLLARLDARSRSLTNLRLQSPDVAEVSEANSTNRTPHRNLWRGILFNCGHVGVRSRVPRPRANGNARSPPKTTSCHA